MRILSIFFFYFLLSVVALSILLLLTQGAYYIERSKIINSPAAAVYNYVNDYRNWEDFGTWSGQDAEMKFSYPENTIGKGHPILGKEEMVPAV
jgi:hypothetical protein